MIGDDEKLERGKLVGYCEKDQEWYKFTDDTSNPAGRNCINCGGTPSSRIGNQITTQRTFDPKSKKLTKAQIKKMGGIGA